MKYDKSITYYDKSITYYDKSITYYDNNKFMNEPVER